MSGSLHAREMMGQKAIGRIPDPRLRADFEAAHSDARLLVMMRPGAPDRQNDLLQVCLRAAVANAGDVFRISDGDVLMQDKKDKILAVLAAQPTAALVGILSVKTP